MGGSYNRVVLIVGLFIWLAGCARGGGVDTNPDAPDPAGHASVAGDASPVDGVPAANGSASAAGANTAENAPSSGSVPLRIAYGDAEAVMDPLAYLLMDKLGVSVTPIPYPEGYTGYVEVLLASGDLPDAFPIRLEPGQMHTLMDGGLIRSIPDPWLDDCPLLTAVLQNDRRVGAYETLQGGGAWFIPRVNDQDPAYGTDSRRIFYRKDHPYAAQIKTPVTTDDLYAMASAYAAGTPDGESFGGLVITGAYAEVFAGFFGISPGDWVLEGERYVPAYFTDAMLAPLRLARRLWEDGLLAFADGDGALLAEYGIVITDGTDAPLDHVAHPLADALGITPAEAYESYVGLLDIPQSADSAAEPVWPYRYRPEGWVFNAASGDAVLNAALSLFEYSLTEEARAYARYGIEGVTYMQNEAGMFRFTDPETNRAYDLTALYPTGSAWLRLITMDLAREAPPEPRYYRPSLSETAALCDAVPSPKRDALAVDYNQFFMRMVTDEDPVEDAFARFRDECRLLGLEEAAEEVTAAVRALAHSPH